MKYINRLVIASLIGMFLLGGLDIVSANTKPTKAELQKTLDLLNEYPDDTEAYLSKKGENFALGGDSEITTPSGETTKISESKDYLATTVGDLKAHYRTQIENADANSGVTKVDTSKRKVKKASVKKSFFSKIMDFFNHM